MSRRTGWKRMLLPALLLVAAGALGAEGEATSLRETSCLVCHSDESWFDEESLAITGDFARDVHAEVGLSCHDCHGGNPDPELADDLDGAKDELLEDNPFRGAPASRREVADFCGSCHSDPNYMRRFRPDARVDQEAEYYTSEHGLAMAAGDEVAATCTDCHGVHGIRRPSSPDSRVYPTRVAETCAGCHADVERMAGRELADGRPLPTDQFGRWQRSVHAAAMFEREDLTAPTCNDCHGNHGAAPPGLESVTFVCGQCHGREAEIFRASPKHSGYVEHNEYLLEVGSDGCALCHDDEPRASMVLTSFAECSSCHGNHGVVRPSVAMFSDLPATPCAFCHEGSESAAVPGSVDEPAKIRQSYEKTLAGLLEEENELEGASLFDRLVDRALRLPEHTFPTAAANGDEPTLRPEFERLFTKFRIGKTHYSYPDPVTGEQVTVDIVRCSSCHAVGVDESELEAGAATGIWFVRRMQELTERTARAERTLLRAQRGGVEVREAATELDQAVDAQIGLEVLVHTFSTEEDEAFHSRYLEGLDRAEAALAAGGRGLDELRYRRRGLLIALVFIVLVLVGLAAKIREVSRREAAAGR